MTQKNERRDGRGKRLLREEKRMDYRSVQIGLFFGVLLVLAVISWIIPLHPTTSEAEKRDLAAFPEFSVNALLSGDYFDGINTWFADTFPFRDAYVSANGAVQDLLTLGGTAVHGDVQQGDDIPDAPNTPGTDEDVTPPAGADEDPNGEEEQKQPEEEEKKPEDVVEPDMTDVPVEKLGAILIAGDTAYEYYNFSQSAADTYVAAMNRAASLLEGRATVYDMIVPTSMDITLPSSVRSGITNTSDQRKAMDYMYDSMSESVKKVDAYDTLRAHRDEYIYYRTDHHWTALGAYYAYREYCKTRGTEAADLAEKFTEANYEGFLGSFYVESGKKAALSAPDTVTAYVPKDTNSIAITQNDGSPLNWNIVTDVSSWASGAKYSCFIGGDNAWSVIENPNVTDGSACIVIKESFGNSLVPFLVPDYQKIYVVDYRYISKVKSEKLSAMVDATGAKDVLFINNISATRNESLMKAVAQFVG